MAKVFLGCPVYGNQLALGAAQGLYGCPSRSHHLEIKASSASLLPLNCNSLWAAAHNAREQRGVEWFAMLHSDVEPEPGWIDVLLAEAEKSGADVLSAVIPLKDGSGLTSTAIAGPANPTTAFHRFALAQVLHPTFPRTFDLAAACQALESLPPPHRIENVPRTQLLCNTGCMLCRLSGNWCNPSAVYFDEINGVIRQNGEWTAVARSEDWRFTELAAANGARVMATTAVKLIHYGGCGYPNDRTWNS